MKRSPVILIIFFLTSLPACQTAYYEVWEKLGKEKRDLLRDNVGEVKSDQAELQDEFKDALEKLRHEYKWEPGKLERVYDEFSSDYENVEEKRAEIRERIEKVERIAGDLFAEWKKEAGTITNTQWRRDSLQKLQRSKDQFQTMREGMRGMQKKLEPVLAKMRDYKLYLKHNLNAKSMQGLRAESADIEREIQNLIVSIEKSMTEVEAFAKTLSN